PRVNGVEPCCLDPSNVAPGRPERPSIRPPVKSRQAVFLLARTIHAAGLLPLSTGSSRLFSSRCAPRFFPGTARPGLAVRRTVRDSAATTFYLCGPARRARHQLPFTPKASVTPAGGPTHLTKGGRTAHQAAHRRFSQAGSHRSLFHPLS